MSIRDYKDPIVSQWNMSNGDKYSKIINNEPHTVVSGMFALIGLPDIQQRVIIDGYLEIGERDEIKEVNQFKVDYTNGYVFMHSSQEGKSINVTKYGSRGVNFYPASRVWTKLTEDGSVEETLKDITDQIDDALELSNRVQEAENIRIQNEDIRIDNENNRIVTENQRVIDEQNRENAEIVRNSNEENRITKEQERLQSEITRVQNELNRISNEDERILLKSQLETLKTQLEDLRDHLVGGNFGDMYKAVYDTNNNGKVDMAEDSEKLGGILANEYSTKSYVDSQITLVTETGIPKLNVYEYKFNSVQIGTTEILIPLDTFDKQTDTVKLYINTVPRDTDFFTVLDTVRDIDGSVIQNGKIVLNQSLQKVSKVTIEVWKNIPIGEYGSVSGTVIAIDSMPQNRVQGLADHMANNDAHGIDVVKSDLATHKAEDVTEAGGVHGLEIESGTWTPTLFGTTTAGNNTYTNRVGTYLKIGNLVHITMRITLSTLESVGALGISGLPFITSSQDAAVSISDLSRITFDSQQFIVGKMLSNNGNINLMVIRSGTTSAILNASNLVNNSEIRLNATYRVE